MEVFQRIREWLVLILIIGLPFHAFLVTVGTRVFVGPGHVPLPWLAGWKEMLLGIVLVVALVEIVRSLLVTRYSFRVDVLDGVILGLLALSVVLPITYHLSPITYIYGFKYTLFPLLLFLVLRRVSWSERFLLLTSYFLLLVGAIVAGYGIFTLFLSESFFTWFGYSDLHSLYLPDGPLAAFQKIEGTGIRRMQSTFSGPNQLGMWLLIPWSLGVMAFVESWGSVMVSSSNHGTRVSHFDGLSVTRSMFLILIVGIALFLTFSRAAWIGAAVIVGVLLTIHYKLLTRWKLLGYWVIGFLGVAVIGAVLFPELLLRTASSREHWRRPMEAIRIIAVHPLGLGLGSAGPASNRASDPCVFLEGGADISWAKDRPNLCVFSGDVQVQPAGRVCRCPFLPENWYLQVGVELGMFGFFLYIVLILSILFALQRGRGQKWEGERRPDVSHFHLSSFIFPLFLGISVAALFLHAWEDSAVAYTVWILLAGALPLSRQRNPH